MHEILAEMESAKRDLDKACKTDVGNQVLRGVISAALAPIGMVSRNLEIAGRESGVVAEVLAATTGLATLRRGSTIVRCRGTATKRL